MSGSVGASGKRFPEATRLEGSNPSTETDVKGAPLHAPEIASLAVGRIDRVHGACRAL